MENFRGLSPSKVTRASSCPSPLTSVEGDRPRKVDLTRDNVSSYCCLTHKSNMGSHAMLLFAQAKLYLRAQVQACLKAQGWSLVSAGKTEI